MLSLIKVSGDSMSPTLKNGDYILIKKKPRSFRSGFIYVIMHERLGRIVKRLQSKEGESLLFEGDNPASTSSRNIGVIKPTSVVGRALFAITPKGIKRLR